MKTFQRSAAILCLILSPHSAIAQDRSIDLFEWRGETAIPTLDSVSEEYLVTVDLQSLLLGVDEIRVTLPNQSRATLALDRFEDKDGVLRFAARGEGMRLIGIAREDGISAMIFGGGTHSLTSTATNSDGFRLRRIDTSAFVPDRDLISLVDKAELEREAKINAQKGVLPPPTAPSTVTIKFAVAYTPAAMIVASIDAGYTFPNFNTDPIEDSIENAVNTLETAMGDSDLGWIDISFDTTNHLIETPVSWGIVDGGTVQASLFQIGGNFALTPADPDFFPDSTIVAWQEQNEIDHLHVVFEDFDDPNMTGPEGIAYANYDRKRSGDLTPQVGEFLWNADFFSVRRTYSISKWDTNETNMTLAHEFGHTLGMAHARLDAQFSITLSGWHSSFDSPETDSRAHYDSTAEVSTIMANAFANTGLCANGCDRDPIFSNSTETYPTDSSVTAGNIQSAENYRTPFETARAMSFFYPSELFEDSFSANGSTCDSTPVGWDVTTGTTAIAATSPGGLACALELANSSTVGTVEETTTNDESFRSRYLLDLGDISTAVDAEKVKIHNMQCVGTTGCPTPGIVQHKLKGGDAQVPFRIRGWFRETVQIGLNPYPKVKWTVDLQAGINVIETEVIIGDPGCTGIGRVWINNDDEQNPDIEENDLCNQGFVEGVDRAKYGVLAAPTTEWITKHGTEALYFDDIVERQWTFIGCGSVSC